ncbi:hypothetical protein [Oculatella sp. FACHB-28]|uniref:hypothetical protein n=1 Tax=Oculatella sp. FACHB-28 TaxID=2692845 RepID=UPI0018EFDD11|nr:hypothetical protein [Oculatella sp. FACHB-28]
MDANLVFNLHWYLALVVNGGRAGFHRKEVLVSPSQNQFPNSSQSASSPEQPENQAASSPSPEPANSAETSTNNMDQQPNATLESAPPTVLDASEAMSEENLESEEKPKAIPPLMPPKPAPAPAPSVAAADSTVSKPASAPTPDLLPIEASEISSEGDDAEDVDSQIASMRQQPIPPASEPMQYRAIGLVRGRYEPSDEQFTRGFLHTEDGTAIDAVLLGRVMSLVKKHVDLEQPHLWVVYPRTREKNTNLHVQIVGVWEPEKLNKVEGSEVEGSEQPANTEETALSGSAQVEADASAIDSPGHEDGYFSIRGEVLFQSQEDQRLIVKIQQSPRRGDSQGRAFKLNLEGVLTGKAVGYFWDLQVQRQENLLVVQDGTMIGLVPPKKRQDSKGGGGRKGGRPMAGGYGKKRWEGSREGQRPSRGDKPVGAPPQRREPLAKPIKRRDNSSQSNPG